MRLKIPARARVVHEFPGDWTLYRLADQQSSFLWLPFRLMLPPGTPARRGIYRRFALNWNPAECRFARSRAVQDLTTQQPELAAAVELYMSLNYGPAWLASEDGGSYTPAEIQAESDRLAAERAQRKATRGARARQQL